MEDCQAWSLKPLARQRDISDEMPPDDQQQSRALLTIRPVVVTGI